MLLTVLLDVGGSSFWPGVLPEIYVAFLPRGVLPSGRWHA